MGKINTSTYNMVEISHFIKRVFQIQIERMNVVERKQRYKREYNWTRNNKYKLIKYNINKNIKSNKDKIDTLLFWFTCTIFFFINL